MNAEGWVLAGGRSLRMGSDKAAVLLAGRPLLGHMLQKIHSLGLRARVAGLRQTVPNVAAEIIRDEHPDCGPLSGIETALAESEADYVLVLGVDLPLIEVEFLAWMVARAQNTRAIATVSRVGGEPQPLCGVYRRQMLAAVKMALAEGKYKTMHAVERSALLGAMDLFDAETLLASGAWHSVLPVYLQLMNCNAPEDVARAEAIFSVGPML